MKLVVHETRGYSDGESSGDAFLVISFQEAEKISGVFLDGGGRG
jgi:hypothetical protein